MTQVPRLILVAALLLTPVLAGLAPQAVAAPARTPSRSLLQNGDFERSLGDHDWMPTSWDTSMAGLPTVFFGRDSFLVHGGSWSANIANMSLAYPMAHNWNQTMLVGPEAWGKTAVLKVWVRNNGIEGRAYIMLQAFRDTVTRMSRIWNVDRDEAFKRLNISKMDDPMLDLGWKRTQFDEPLTEWVLREARTHVPPGTNVLFARCGLLGTGQVLFDDASLTFESAAPRTRPALGENLLREPGFEEHGLAWDLAIPPYEGARINVDSSVAHTGKASLRISNFHDGIIEARIGAGQPFDGRALRGQRVRLTAWFKGDSLRGTVFAKIFAHGLRSNVTKSPGSELLWGTFDWRLVTAELDIAPDVDLIWANCQALAPGKGTAWIDDVKFEVLGPATGARLPAARPKP